MLMTPWRAEGHRYLAHQPDDQDERYEVRREKLNIVNRLLQNLEQNLSVSEFRNSLLSLRLEKIKAIDEHFGFLFSQTVNFDNITQNVVIQFNDRQDIVVNLLETPENRWEEIRKHAFFLIDPKESSHDFSWAIKELCSIPTSELRKKVVDFTAKHYKWGMTSMLRARILSSVKKTIFNNFDDLINDKKQAKEFLKYIIEMHQKELDRTVCES